MASLTSQLIVRLIDGVSGPARRAAGALRALNNASRGGGGMPMVAMQDRLNRAVEKNNRAIGVLRGRLFDMTAMGYGLHRGLTPAVSTAMNFETTLEDIGQKADISGDKLKRIGKRIRDIGKQTNNAALDVGAGVDFLLGMGLGGATDVENLENALDMSPAIGKTATAYRASIEDIARSSHSVFQNMKVPAEQTQYALDAMAKAGKMGGFELKDMARDFPAITASAQFMGSEGVAGVADLAAALQVARKGARDGSQAANNLANFFQKMTLKETVNNFKKFGVDIYKELDNAREKGISPIEHMMGVLKAVTKGDGDLVSQIFGDKQVLEFIRPMWDNMDEYRRIREEALAARGEVEKDFARRMKTSATLTKAFAVQLENLGISLGNALLPGFTKIIGKLGEFAMKLEDFAEKNPQLAAGIVGVAAGLLGLGIAAAGISLAARYAYGGLLMLARGASLAGRGVRMAARPMAWLAGGIGSRILGFFQTFRLRAKLASNPGVFARIADGFILLGRGALRALTPMNLLRGAMAGLRMMGPVGWTIAAGIGALAIAANNLDGIAAFAGGFWDKFTEGLSPLKGMLDPIANAFSSIGSSLSEMFSFDVGTFKSIGEAMGSFSAGALVGTIQGVVDAFRWVIDKANAAKEAVSNFFGAAGSFMAGDGAASNKSGRAGNPAARARGGRVTKGQSYLVGEKRPELFTPGQSGYVNSRVPEGGGSGPVSVTNHFTISGAHDPQAIADEVERRFSNKLNFLFRGIQADARFNFGY